jgi:hypothetical protein
MDKRQEEDERQAHVREVERVPEGLGPKELILFYQKALGRYQDMLCLPGANLGQKSVALAVAIADRKIQNYEAPHAADARECTNKARALVAARALTRSVEAKFADSALALCVAHARVATLIDDTIRKNPAFSRVRALAHAVRTQ